LFSVRWYCFPLPLSLLILFCLSFFFVNIVLSLCFLWWHWFMIALSLLVLFYRSLVFVGAVSICLCSCFCWFRFLLFIVPMVLCSVFLLLALSRSQSPVICSSLPHFSDPRPPFTRIPPSRVSKSAHCHVWAGICLPMFSMSKIIPRYGKHGKTDADPRVAMSQSRHRVGWNTCGGRTRVRETGRGLGGECGRYLIVYDWNSRQ
jgi:hypothetical protein